MGSKENLGLVLSGGGARSAYQVGVVCGLRQIGVDEKIEDRLRFSVVAGTSGGAINGAHLACHADDFKGACEELWAQWEHLKLEDVVRSDGWPLFKKGFKLISQLSSGGHQPTENVINLLDTTPLTQMLYGKLDFKRLRKNIASGLFQGLALTATHYGTGTSVCFYEGADSIQEWMRSNRIGLKTRLGLKHVLASSAIPFLFPPAKIKGSYYGDGAVRSTAPLSPAIHLGADRVIAVGVRYYRSPQETVALNKSKKMEAIQFADISGVLLNAIFMDAVDSDLERMERINRTLGLVPQNGSGELRRIPVLAIRPSVDLGQLAKDQLKHFSWVLRHLMRGLGASKGHGSDLVSYLAFDRSYTLQLLELGFKDALNQKDAVLRWLNA